MFAIRRKQRSGSSQGQGGHTRKEQPTNGKVETTEVMTCRAPRGVGGLKQQSSELNWGKTKSKHTSNERDRNSSLKRFTERVDAVLEKLMSRSSPHLWENQLLEVLKQFDDSKNRKRIHLYMETIARLINRLESEKNSWTRNLLRKTLKSYKNRLDEARGIRTSTPSSSDDEDSEEFEEVAEEMFENPSLRAGRLPKVNDTINLVETPKTNIKIKKANQVAPDEDTASHTSTRKNLKNLKNLKDEEDAGPWRIHEAQRKVKETEKPKPAAPKSTRYQYQPAAEVLKTELYNHSLDTLTTSFSIIKNPSNISMNDDIKSVSGSREMRPLHYTQEETVDNDEETEESGQDEEDEDKWCEWGCPLQSTKVSGLLNVVVKTEKRKMNDVNPDDKSWPKDSWRNEAIKLLGGTEILIDGKIIRAEIDDIDKVEKSTKYQTSEEQDEEELHMQWSKWPYPEVHELSDPKQTTRPRGDKEGEPKDELTHKTNSSRLEGRLKGGTKMMSAVQKKVKKKLDELAKRTMKTEIFKSTESSSRSKNRPDCMKEEGWRMGLKNLKNTCYFNAAMQGFASCTLLREAIIKAPEKDWKESRLTRRMKVMFLEMNKPDRERPWIPEEMFNEICTWEKCVGYKQKTQQDAGELIRCIIEHLSEENKTAGKLFLADQANITKCSNCSEETAIEQKFKTLALNIEDNKWDRIDGVGNMEKRDKSIEGLLRRYTSWEKLTKGNESKCSACGKHQVPDRQTQFVYGPNILVMQLKRFTKREEQGITITTKLNTKVHYQEELSLPCQLSSIGVTANYQLKGVIEHRGENAGNGHYATYALDGNQWFEWNDELGKPVTWETVEKAEAYILFWERKYEEGVQTYEEYEWIEEDEIEGEGEEGKTMSKKVGSGNGNTHIDVEEVEAQKVVPIDKKRRLEPYKNFICERLRLEPRVTVKRHKSNAEEIKEEKQAILGTTERASKWRRKPKGRQKPEAYNEGETPTVGDSYESCLEEEMEAEPNQNEAYEANKLEAIRQLIGTAMNEIKELKLTVKQQSLEITRLKLNLSSLKAKVNVRVLSEDEDRFRDEEMYTKNLPRNSTPVGRKAAEKIQHTSHVNNPRPHKMSSTHNRQIEENGTWIRNNQHNRNPESHNEGDHEMEVEYAKNHSHQRPTPVSEGRQHRKWKNQKNPHEEYLEECFRNQIGMPTERPQRINIYNFKNKLVANGYQRVVTTWQGMYYEMTKQQVEWRNLKDRGVTIGGDYRWGTEGLTVYKPIKEMPTSTVVRHRFAMLPPQGSHRRRLRTDRYYIHVYQTKIGDERKTLQSRKIAQELGRRYRKYYYPREVDKFKQEGRRRDSNEPWRSRGYGINKTSNNQDDARVKLGTARKQEETRNRAQTKEPSRKPWGERMDKNEGQGRFQNQAPTTRNNGTKSKSTNTQMNALVRKLNALTAEFLEGTF